MALRRRLSQEARQGVLILLLAASASCQPALLAADNDRGSIHSESRFALGPVMVSVQVVTPDGPAARRALGKAFEAIEQVNNFMSAHLAKSEISRLNENAGRECRVSRETAFVLRKSVEFSELTGGTFDVTAGPIIRIWKKTIADVSEMRESFAALETANTFFGPAAAAIIDATRQTLEVKLLPDPRKLAAARELVGYKKLTVGADSARLAEPGMSVDLGGIAKGYAVDAALAVLRERGLPRALVAGSGDLAVGDPPPGQRGWRIEITPLDVTNAPPVRFVLLARAAIATSGDVFQRVEIGGKRYSHIVDPRTGIGLTDHSLVTVVARDCTTADSLATAVSVLGPEKGLRLVRRTPGAAVRMVRQPGERLEAVESRGFREFYAPAGPDAGGDLK